MANMTTIHSISSLLQESLDPATSKQAEQALRAHESGPGFALLLLHIVASGDQGQIPWNTRLAAALFFKNFIRRNWTDEEGRHILNENDVAAVKREIIGLMISLPPSLQVQLGEAISIIADSDFYERWNTLVDDLVSRLTPDDVTVNNGVLTVAHSIFKRWRPLFRSDALFTEINHVLGKFSQPYLKLLVTTDQLIKNNKANKQTLGGLFQTMNLLVKIFYDLSCQDLPPAFEENLTDIMRVFHEYLVYSNPLMETDDEDESGPLERIKAGICEILVLYTQKYEDVFDAVLGGFVDSTWMLLTNIGLEPKYDILVSKALQFLTAVARIQRHAANFNRDEVLGQVVEKIILPNMTLRSSDEELFEDDPIEFIRRDLEGSDSETRRRATTDFLRQLLEQFEKLVTEVVFRYISHYLQEYARNPQENWKSKDTALYLFTSVAIKGTVGSIGVTSTNLLVDVVKFFQDNVAADLIAASNSLHPILKVDAVRYLHTFRSQMTKGQLSDAFPLLVKHLASPNFVVYTYTAITVERILAMSAEGRSLFSTDDIAPYSRELLTHLFRLINIGKSPEKIAENEWLIKCVMRILIISREATASHAEFVLPELIRITAEISKNPSNPRFNHYCFECFGAIIRFVAPKNPAYLESTLDSPFMGILAQDVQEFVPYVFQLLAFLLESNPSAPLPERYQALITPLLAPVIWESKGNVPALVRLLSAIMARGSSVIISANEVEPILGIFQKLVSSKLNEAHAFELLESTVATIPSANLFPYWKQIFVILFTRLNSSKTPTFGERFVRFFWYLVNIEKLGYGGDFVISKIDDVQAGIFGQLYSAVVCPDTVKLQKPQERKVAVAGIVRFLIHSQQLFAKYSNTLPRTGTALVKLLEQSAPILVQDAGDVITHEVDIDEVAFGVAFSNLNTTRKAPTDLVPDVPSGYSLKVWVRESLKPMSEKIRPLVGQVEGLEAYL